MSGVARSILELLEPLLGRHTAEKALELAAKRCHKPVDALDRADLPEVTLALRPMLRTLLGATAADKVMEGLRGGGAGDG